MDIETVAELEVEVSEIGEKGYSAYEVAVQNGFVGTETEWLASLKGADGINGHDGRDGQDGENGTNGQDGITPTIGDNGNWYLGETDTGKPSRGIQGIQGVAGQDGKDGQDGFSPIATVTQSSGVTTISITDKNGTTSQSIDLSNYQSKIDSSHKLSSDLVDDTNNTNKFVSSAEKTKINVITTNGTGNNYLADDGTYKGIDLSNYATKSYVDNSIASAITTTLGGSY